MSWIIVSMHWYIMLLIIGAIFFPVSKRLLGGIFLDRGYAFSKIIGILVVSYLLFFLGSFKIIPFYRESIFLILVIFLCFSVYKRADYRILGKMKPTVLFHELLFFISLLFWAFVRSQEPSIRGLEKFMDYGFMNSILRSDYFPPADIWYAGGTINYYYFGHLTGSVLTKLSALPPEYTYNLILATIFALSITETYSLAATIIRTVFKKSNLKTIAGAMLSVFLVNFSGNLHTIYLFTKGYNAEKPVPFWEILSGYNPLKYWYPNATRFIPFTIHEFPIYSYVVADLHGHVFAIPFVLLTLSILFNFFVKMTAKKSEIKIRTSLIYSVVLGFLCAVHYMTNAFDGPIYLLLTTVFLFIFFRFSKNFVSHLILLIGSFLIFSLPFSVNFTPFVSGIGVNCSPDFLVSLQKIGPFLFEKGNCQISAPWMLFILWGFFLINFAWYAVMITKTKNPLHGFFLTIFTFSTALLIIPEFFYIKDIYPAHFRANTMFKLGYQAFIMLSLASSYTFILYKSQLKEHKKLVLGYLSIFTVIFFFVGIYPYFAITSYYGNLTKKPNLDGISWLSGQYPEYKEIISYLNKNIPGQPTILEAQGDSYTDYNVVSSYTGLSTVAGWWVHEWLWRGDSSVVGDRIPEVVAVYEGNDLNKTLTIINKYKIKYIIVGSHERQKYKNLNESKLKNIGEVIFTSTNNLGKIYAVK